jgi:hypothetical protein
MTGLSWKYLEMETIATVGPWLVLIEAQRVFVRPIAGAPTTRWQLLPGVRRVASEPGGRSLFVVRDSLDVEFLNDSLRPIWRAPRALAGVAPDAFIEGLLMRGGVGYVLFSDGNVLRASPVDGEVQWLAPPR